MNPRITTEIVRESAAFAQLGREWNRLLEESAGNTIFLRWEWLYSWWEVYGQEDELFIIAVREDDILVGIAPLFSTRHGLFATKLKFLGANQVCSDYLDFILIKEREAELMAAILGRLDQCREEWDLLELSGLPAGSPSLPLLTAFFRSHLAACQERYTVCPYLDLSPPWETIRHSFSPLLQNSLKRKLKRLGQFPEARFVQAGEDGARQENFARFLTLNRLRLAEKRIASPFLDPQFLEFHRRLLALLLPREMAELCFLQIAGNDVAAIYLFTCNHRRYYYQSGFDPAWQHLSPGTLLLHFCLEEAHARGMSEFDFLQGDEEYKSNWTTQQRINRQITIYNQTLRGYLAPLSQLRALRKTHISRL